MARDRPAETIAAGAKRQVPLSYFKTNLLRSAIHVMPREMHSTPSARTHQVSIGVEAPLRELLTVFPSSFL